MIRFNCPNCNRPYELPPALAFLPLVCKQCGQRLTPPADEPDAPPPPRAPVPPKPVVTAPPKPALPVAKIVAPPPAKPAAPVAKPLAAKPSAPPKPPPEDDEDEDDGVLVTKPDESPDVDFNVGGPTAASLSDATRARPAGLSDANRPRPADLDGSPGIDELQKINLDLLGPAPPPVPKRAPKPPPEEEPPEAPPEPTLMPFVADLVVFVLLVVGGMFIGELLAKKTTGQVLASAASVKFPPVDLLLWGGPPVLFALIYLLLGARKLTVGEWLRRRKK